MFKHCGKEYRYDVAIDYSRMDGDRYDTGFYATSITDLKERLKEFKENDCKRIYALEVFDSEKKTDDGQVYYRWMDCKPAINEIGL